MTVRYIYALVDPRYSEVRYVGVSTDPWTRTYHPYTEGRPWQSHVAEVGHTGSHKAWWISGILQSNMVPVLVILEFGEWSVFEAAEREIDWITFYRGVGASLVNKSGGGEQTSLWQQSAEMRALISERTRAALAVLSPEARERMHSSRRGRTPWNKGRVTRKPRRLLTPEEMAQSYAERGRKTSATKAQSPRIQCECGKSLPPGPFAMHHRATQHQRIGEAA